MIKNKKGSQAVEVTMLMGVLVILFLVVISKQNYESLKTVTNYALKEGASTASIQTNWSDAKSAAKETIKESLLFEGYKRDGVTPKIGWIESPTFEYCHVTRVGDCDIDSASWTPSTSKWCKGDKIKITLSTFRTGTGDTIENIYELDDGIRREIDDAADYTKSIITFVENAPVCN